MGHAFDTGYSCGILLNTVAMQLEEEGRSTRAASLNRQITAVPALCTARIERALEYVDALGRRRASAAVL